MSTLVVDASCLHHLVTGGAAADAIRRRIAPETELVAPHLVDVEVIGLIRRDFQRGNLDRTSAESAEKYLNAWPGERFSHKALLDRVWQLRDNIATADAFYVALAESLRAALLTLDTRLSNTPRNQVPGNSPQSLTPKSTYLGRSRLLRSRMAADNRGKRARAGQRRHANFRKSVVRPPRKIRCTRRRPTVGRGNNQAAAGCTGG